MVLYSVKYYPIKEREKTAHSTLTNFHTKFSFDLGRSDLAHEVKHYFGVSKADILVQNICQHVPVSQLPQLAGVYKQLLEQFDLARSALTGRKQNKAVVSITSADYSEADYHMLKSWLYLLDPAAAHCPSDFGVLNTVEKDGILELSIKSSGIRTLRTIVATLNPDA